MTSQIVVADEYLLWPVLRCRHCQEDRPHNPTGSVFSVACQTCGTTRCTDRDCRACATGGRP